MFRKLSFSLVAFLVASPAIAQSVVVSESAPQTRALSPSLGETESLPIVTPAQAQALIEVPMVDVLPESGEVSSTLGAVETLPVVTPAVAETVIEIPTVESASAPSVLDTLPRVSADEIATIIVDSPLSVDPEAPAAEQDVSLYVIEDGTVLPSSEWTAKDSETCKTSGGVELPLPGGRIGCFKI